MTTHHYTYCEVHYMAAVNDATTTMDTSRLCLGTTDECDACHPPEGQSCCPICSRPDLHTSCDHHLTPRDQEIYKEIANLLQELKTQHGYDEESAGQLIEELFGDVFLDDEGEDEPDGMCPEDDGIYRHDPDTGDAHNSSSRTGIYEGP